MESNETFVEQTENVEQTTEQTPKTYTQEEVDAIVGKRVARNTAKVEKKFQREYGDLVDVLRAGTGKESVGELTTSLRSFYQRNGVKIPTKPSYSAEDIEKLARADADEIIRSGYDDVVEEVDRLAKLGNEGMSERERAVFRNLAEHRQTAENGRELAKLGVTEDVYTSKEFMNFRKKFSATTPITEVYDIYSKTQPKKDIKPMGSVKSTASGDVGIKDFYTVDEARRFTKQDYDNNPGLYDAVENSSYKWK